MTREHNSTAAHFDMTRHAEQTRIGAHFHKPAPVRATRRADRGASAGFLVCFVIPAACLAAFFAQL